MKWDVRSESLKSLTAMSVPLCSLTTSYGDEGPDRSEDAGEGSSLYTGQMALQSRLRVQPSQVAWLAQPGRYQRGRSQSRTWGGGEGGRDGGGGSGEGGTL